MKLATCQRCGAERAASFLVWADVLEEGYGGKRETRQIVCSDRGTCDVTRARREAEAKTPSEGER